jgi:hypothetical protein
MKNYYKIIKEWWIKQNMKSVIDGKTRYINQGVYRGKYQYE